MIQINNKYLDEIILLQKRLSGNTLIAIISYIVDMEAKLHEEENKKFLLQDKIKVKLFIFNI